MAIFGSSCGLRIRIWFFTSSGSGWPKKTECGTATRMFTIISLSGLISWSWRHIEIATTTTLLSTRDHSSMKLSKYGSLLLFIQRKNIVLTLRSVSNTMAPSQYSESYAQQGFIARNSACCAIARHFILVYLCIKWSSLRKKKRLVRLTALRSTSIKSQLETLILIVCLDW